MSAIPQFKKTTLSDVVRKYDSYHDRTLLILNLEAQNRTNELLEKIVASQSNSPKSSDLKTVNEISLIFDVNERTVRNKANSGELKKHPGKGRYEYFISEQECRNINLKGYQK